MPGPFVHITRTLIANKGGSEPRTLLETELDPAQGPFILLGEPGSGKSELTRALAERLSLPRTAAGAFTREHDLAALQPAAGGLLVIDALDEVAPQAGGSSLGEVLRKLAAMGRPSFLVSCRSVDWEGSADRHQIKSDYGRDPVTLHLEPLTEAEAKRLLAHHAPDADADSVLRALSDNGLEELCGNPLTVELIAAVAQEGGGLPSTKAELFERACVLLVREENPAHKASAAARARVEELLDSGGAICACIILASLVGVSRRPPQDTPAGFAPFSEFEALPDAPLAAAALSTRLFQDAGENLLAPMHRVVAEYLGARWLARRVAAGLSVRRLFAALEFAGGVPSALRGLHAWLANHQPAVAGRCIDADPYGVLRYGDPGTLSTPQAARLLKALSSLAKEDPWFRNGDWSVSGARGLVRPELKQDLLALVTGPNRHFHLSTLLIGSIGESAIGSAFADELLAIARDSGAIYAERRYALDALAASGVTLDWGKLTREILAEPIEDAERLAIDAVEAVKARGFSAKDLATLFLRYLALEGPKAAPGRNDPDNHYVYGVLDGLIAVISGKQAGAILDQIARRAARRGRAEGYDLQMELARVVRRLAARYIDSGGKPSGKRLWEWLTLAAETSSAHDADDAVLKQYGASSAAVRRAAQRAALADTRFGPGVWMSLAHYLPGCRANLEMMPADAVHFLRKLRAKPSVTPAEEDAWYSIIRLQVVRDGGMPPAVRDEAMAGVAAHAGLKHQWDILTTPPKRDWLKEQRRRGRHQASKRRRQFEKARQELRGHLAELEAGEMKFTTRPAWAFLGRMGDLNNGAPPRERLEEWLGHELAEVARRGFVNALGRSDLPSAKAIARSHAAGRNYHMEHVIKAGLVELVAEGRDLAGVDRAVLQAALVSWWHFPDFEGQKLKFDLGARIEAALFTDDAALTDFLRVFFEAQLAANLQHVAGLHRLAREAPMRPVAGGLALEWLEAYPTAPVQIVRELLDIAIDNLPQASVAALVHKRLADASLSAEARDLWLSASFAVDWPRDRAALAARAAADREFLFWLRKAFGPERLIERRRTLLPEQYAFVVEQFALQWPMMERPMGGEGDNHGWEASDLISGCLNTLANDPSAEAAAALASLAPLSSSTYGEELLHMRARQQRRRRDSEFMAPTMGDVRQLVTSGLPGRIDDLKALTLDVLAELQRLMHGSETSEWRLFWDGGAPKSENSCRDALISLTQPRFPAQIQVLPESLMPRSKRADAVVLLGPMGVPIEIKGQWHPQVWSAVLEQLEALYTPSWRADGRGIYLVFWFGPISGRNPPRRKGKPAPTTADEMRRAIIEEPDEATRDRIDVVVLDVSDPTP